MEEKVKTTITTTKEKKKKQEAREQKRRRAISQQREKLHTKHPVHLRAEGPVPGQVLVVVREPHPCNGLVGVPPRQLAVRGGGQAFA